MDVSIYLKQRVDQPSGSFNVPEDNIFDFKPVLSGDTITGLLLVEGEDELQQASLFAALKQYGGNPVLPSEGLRWAESLIGEYPTEFLMEDIKNAVQAVSTACGVEFLTTTVDGKPTLSFELKVIV